VADTDTHFRKSLETDGQYPLLCYFLRPHYKSRDDWPASMEITSARWRQFSPWGQRLVFLSDVKMELRHNYNQTVTFRLLKKAKWSSENSWECILRQCGWPLLLCTWSVYLHATEACRGLVNTTQTTNGFKDPNLVPMLTDVHLKRLHLTTGSKILSHKVTGRLSPGVATMWTTWGDGSRNTGRHKRSQRVCSEVKCQRNGLQSEGDTI